MDDGRRRAGASGVGLIKSSVAHDCDTDMREGGRMRCGDRQHQSAIFATFIYDVRARKFMDILLVTVVLTQLHHQVLLSAFEVPKLCGRHSK